MKKVCAVLIGSVLLVSCSTTQSKVNDRADEHYTVANEQLPPETAYGRTAWVEPPVPLPKGTEGRAWENNQQAPLIQPPSNPTQNVQTPTLPSARASRKY